MVAALRKQSPAYIDIHMMASTGLVGSRHRSPAFTQRRYWFQDSISEKVLNSKIEAKQLALNKASLLPHKPQQRCLLRGDTEVN